MNRLLFPSIRGFLRVSAIACGSLPVASPALPPQIQVRCGVVFTMHAQQNYSGWVNAIPRSMSGTGWTHLIQLGYVPFAELTNVTNTTLTLDKLYPSSSDAGPVVEFDQPELAMRLKRIGASLSGYITYAPVPLSQMYVISTGIPAHHRMTLYGGLDGTGSPAGLVVLGPGQTMILSPYINPASAIGVVLDWQKKLTAAISAVPGWFGPAYGYNADWLCGNISNVTYGLNGDLGSLGVIATRLADAWDVEVEPANGTLPPQCKLYRWQANTPWSGWFGPSAGITSFPFHLTDTGPAPLASSMAALGGTPLSQCNVIPIVVAETGPVTVSMNAVVLASADADGDGMDDAWEAAKFGPGGGDPEADPDKDGFSNLFEFLAGSDPCNGGDFIRQSVTRSGGRVTLRWSSVPGRSYVIEDSDNMLSWSPFATVSGAATPATETAKVITTTGSQRFFRLKILSPY